MAILDDTAPFDVPAGGPPTAPLNVVDDSSGDDDLTERIAAAIDRYVWERRGPQLAALRVLGEPVIVDALRASVVVAQLDRQHQPRQWGPGSDTVVCDTCQRAWPCSVRAVLDGGLT